ncbi:hypothetical protein ACSL103130_10570 [Actinomyces slackii]|uniref:Uncharacterized protein n=2 Tax=Actinomyces slackii TaxID=52774 RepID=A0A3S4SIV6_9ACTO|nr:hypothetical protein [Actinomyces slackii]VEG73659.1 Uncharacterised protein [Actinomyces slackii]
MPMTSPRGGRKALLIYTGRRDGLGNRVRALLSAQALAEAEDRELLYVWSTDAHFGPHMDDLWHFDAGRSVPWQVSRAMSPLFPLRDPRGTVIDERLRASRLWQIRSRGLPVTWSDPAWQEGAGGPRHWTEALRDLRPVDAIAERVGAIFDEHLRSRPYVGVQVRTHAVSHARTIETSPVEWFAQRMRQIRAEHPDVPFFLSCDTVGAQARLMQEFSGCVALEDKGGYNTTAGVRSALTDLYLLASAQHLVGAAHSSFVEMAVFLCDGVVPFERPDQPLEGPVDLSLALVDDPLRPAER